MRTCVLTSSGCSTRISSATSGTGEEPPPGWIPPPHSTAGEPLARLLLAACSFLRSDILATPLWQLYRPSTGAVMLLAAIHTCDEVGSPCTAPPRWCPVIWGWAHGTGRRVPQVSAFGFMTPGYRAYSDHYFDRGHKEVQFFVNHDLKLEMRLWQRLQRSGLLRLYTGTEGT